MSTTLEKMKNALAKAKKDVVTPEESIKILIQIFEHKNESKSEKINKVKEESIYILGKLYGKLGRVNELVNLNKVVRPFFRQLPKAKTARIVRTILDLLGKIPNTEEDQIKVCLESIEWSKLVKRNFLRQRIEARLVALYFHKKKFDEALKVLNPLLYEVKRLDDKALLVEIQLLESRIYFSLKNISKAKAALNSGRTSANSIYCPILLQANIDLQSGIVNAAESDYKTAYSYFFEAFEGFHNLEQSEAIICLKYMILCKILTENIDDIQNILSSKNALKYTGNEINSMSLVAKAYKDRSLHEFQNALKKYNKELMEDVLISNQIKVLNDRLLEQHLLRIIEPYSRVQISHVAKLIGIKLETVEKKLSQMILDKALNGILDQGSDSLQVFDESKKDELYGNSIETIQNMNEVLDSLFERAKQLVSK